MDEIQEKVNVDALVLSLTSVIGVNKMLPKRSEHLSRAGWELRWAIAEHFGLAEQDGKRRFVAYGINYMVVRKTTNGKPEISVRMVRPSQTSASGVH